MSISELHLVEAVGKCGGEGRTISGIAKELDITLPSVTVAINKLMKKDLWRSAAAGRTGVRCG